MSSAILLQMRTRSSLWAFGYMAVVSMRDPVLTSATTCPRLSPTPIKSVCSRIRLWSYSDLGHSHCREAIHCRQLKLSPFGMGFFELQSSLGHWQYQPRHQGPEASTPLDQGEYRSVRRRPREDHYLGRVRRGDVRWLSPCSIRRERRRALSCRHHGIGSDYYC